MVIQADIKAIAWTAKHFGLKKRDICILCLKPIKTIAFKGTGVCSENCRKDRDNDHEPATGGVNGT